MLRFTIRDVLWLTVVAALGVGWWVDRGRLAERTTKRETEVKFWKVSAKGVTDFFHAHDWYVTWYGPPGFSIETKAQRDLNQKDGPIDHLGGEPVIEP